MQKGQGWTLQQQTDSIYRWDLSHPRVMPRALQTPGAAASDPTRRTEAPRAHTLPPPDSHLEGEPGAEVPFGIWAGSQPPVCLSVWCGSSRGFVSPGSVAWEVPPQSLPVCPGPHTFSALPSPSRDTTRKLDPLRSSRSYIARGWGHPRAWPSPTQCWLFRGTMRPMCVSEGPWALRGCRERARLAVWIHLKQGAVSARPLGDWGRLTRERDIPGHYGGGSCGRTGGPRAPEGH